MFSFLFSILFFVPSFDLSYLQRMYERTDLSALFLEPQFLQAQELFFSVVEDMHGEVDFEIADMREVHAVAALWEFSQGKKVLDVGCGSVEAYVLEDTFRDRYPPFFAEMMSRRGAAVTGVDIRTNPSAAYDHLVLDCTQSDWTTSLNPSYDIIACFNVFNAPSSPFEHDASLCDQLLSDMTSLLSADGILILTLRDDLFTDTHSFDDRKVCAEQYCTSHGFEMLFFDGNGVWGRGMKN
jgi:SAM-dependent methyltransferase